MTERRALLVEVDAATQPDLLAFLRLRGYQCVAASSADEAEDALAGASFSFTLVDLNGNGTDAAKLIQCLKLHGRNSGPIIAVADRRDNGLGAVSLEVEAVLHKPPSLNELEQAIETLVRPQPEALAPAPEPMAGRIRREMELWRSPKMLEARQILAEAARVDVTVLVTGEPGTGKELVARAGLARDEHGDVDAGRLGENLACFQHLGAAPELHLASDTPGHRLGRGRERFGLRAHEGLDRLLELVEARWLVEHRLHLERDGAETVVAPVGDRDDGTGIPAVKLQTLNQLCGVGSVAVQIDQREGEAGAGERVLGFIRGRGGDALVSTETQKGEKVRLRRRVDFDQERSSLGHLPRELSGKANAIPRTPSEREWAA